VIVMILFVTSLNDESSLWLCDGLKLEKYIGILSYFFC